MNQLPAELRTPPLPVVAFINCAELHKDIGTYFNTNLRPPLFFVSLPEANEAVLARLFGTPHPPKPFSTPDGILKADWISKQRTRRASVAVTCVLRSDVEGDPTSWMRMTRGLQAVKAASAHKGVWLVLVVVQDGPVSDLPQDRITGLWNSFEPKQLVIISRSLFDPDVPLEQRRQLQNEQLRPLQQLVVEAAAAYYAAAAARQRQKQLDLTTTLGSCPAEISAAIAFKLAVFAEFRQDWQGAVTCYQAAAAALQAVPLGRPTVSCQRHAEVAAVAEVVHFKAMMLLLHQQRHAEAVQQLATHLAVFGRLPDGLPLPAAAAHYGWLVRQYQAAAEMIAGSRMDAATLQAHPEAEPCHLLMSAAQLALTRKNLVDQLSEMSQGPPAFDTSSVKKGRYLGQYERKQPEGPTHSCDLTDAEFCSFLEAEERRINHCQVVLDLLLQAQAAHLKEQLQQQPAVPTTVPPVPGTGTGSRRSAADRVSARLAYLIAEQQIETHNLTAARKLLLQVAYTYRRDRWDALLLHSLLLLRDVCQRLKLHKEALLHSLEVSSLAVSLRAVDAADTQAAAPGFFDSDQARGLASAALLALLAGPQDNKSSLKKPALPQQPPQQEFQQAEQQQQPALQEADAQGQPVIASSPRSSSSGSWEYEVQQLDLAAVLQQMASSQEDGVARASSVPETLLLHKQQDFGWAQLISVSGGFVQHSADPEQLHLAVALRNNLPVALPLESAVLTLSDAQGSWQQALQPGPYTASSSGSKARLTQQGQTGPAGAAADVTAGLMNLQLTEQPLQQPAHSQQQHQAGWPLKLEPGAWQQLHVVFTPRCIGTVACEQLQLRLSEHARVVFKLQSFAVGKPLLGSSVPGLDSPFNLKQQVKLGIWTAKVQHVGCLPQVQVLRPELLLVGEFVPVDIRVAVTTMQPAATLELSVSTASGTTPSQLTLLAALPDGKLHELNLQGQILTVPKLTAGSVWVQHLWVRSRDGTGCRLSATLSCPALVLQHADLSFRAPFEHRVRLGAEAGVHTLVGPSAAFAAVNGSSSGSPAAGGGGNGFIGDAGRQAEAEPGAAGAVPLVVGQSLFAQVLVATGHAADLVLLGADLQLEAGSHIKLLNDVSQQLSPHALVAGPGSVHCLLLHLLPTAKATTPSSIGKLQLSWRRKSAAAVAAPHQRGDSSGGGSGGGSSTASAAAAAAMEAGPSPNQDVQTSLELPQVVVQDSLLSIKASGPQNVTAGMSFAYTLQVHNLTTQPQEAQVSVQDAQGFVFAGSKQQMVNVVPRTILSITWTLVAHASGQMQLPAVRVTATKLGCCTVTQGGTVHVLPY